MGHLIPTPVIDRNGRATTVHRRADQTRAPKASRLASAAPQLAGAPTAAQTAPVTKIRAKDLKRSYPYERSMICRDNMCHWLIDGLWDQGNGHFTWEPADVEIPDEDLYAYLRLGLDLNEVAMLHSVGVSAEQVSSDEWLSKYLPGRLGTVTLGNARSGARYGLRNSEAIDALQEHGVPAAQAYTLIENGLQDGHFNGVLSFEEVTEVLGKWRYYGLQGNYPDQKTSQAIDALISGRVPFELSRTNTSGELARLVDELRFKSREVEFRKQLEEDRELTVRIASHALKGIRPNDYSGTERALKYGFEMYKERGEEMFTVKSLDLLQLSPVDEATGTRRPMAVAEAQFIEDVAKGLRGTTGWARQWDRYNSISKAEKVLSHWDILDLREAGATVEQAQELLIRQEMDPALALSVVRDGIASPLMGGAL